MEAHDHLHRALHSCLLNREKLNRLHVRPNPVCVSTFTSCVLGNGVALLKQCVIIAGWQREPRTSRLTSKSERACAFVWSQIAFCPHSLYVSQQDQPKNVRYPPSAKWTCRSRVQKVWRMSRWWEQSMKSSTKPHLTAQVTPEAVLEPWQASNYLPLLYFNNHLLMYIQSLIFRREVCPDTNICQVERLLNQSLCIIFKI